MNIGIVFSGYLRCFYDTINSLKENLIYNNNNFDIFLHYSKNSLENKYFNKDISIEEIKKRISIKSIIYTDDLLLSDNPNENNTLNQNYKLYILNHHIQTLLKVQYKKYDIIVKIRPDVYLKSKIDYSLVKENTLYVPKDSKLDKNKLKNSDDKYICDIIAYGNYSTMNIYLNFFESNKELIKQYGYVNETILYYYLKKKNITIIEVDIDYYIILSKCNTIAISGDSGSGKTTLSNLISNVYTNSILLECDRYHKWERGNKNWNNYTHLNPEANYITKMQDDVFDLKLGNNIYQVDYNHSTGKFTSKTQIESKDNVIVCGLHSLYLSNDISDLKIYMDTQEDLRIFWKIKRDIIKRGYTKEKVYEQILSRKADFEKYILPQKQEADIIINIYSDDYKFIIENFNADENIIIKYRIGITNMFNINNILSSITSYDKIINDNKIIYLYFTNIHELHNIVINLLKILKKV